MDDEQHPMQKTSLAVDIIFSTLALMYPSRFLKGLSDLELTATTNLWSKQLQGYPSWKIEAAVEKVPDYYPTHPPTIGEFKVILAELNRVTPATVHQVPRLENLKSDTKVGKEAIDGLYKLVGKISVNKSTKQTEAELQARKKKLREQFEAEFPQTAPPKN